MFFHVCVVSWPRERLHRAGPRAYGTALTACSPQETDDSAVVSKLVSEIVGDKHGGAAFGQKLADKVLILGGVNTGPSWEAARKRLKVERARHKNRINAKDRRVLGLHDVEADGVTYDDFASLRELWAGYIGTLTDNVKGDMLMERLLKADYHGAVATVTKSTCPTYVGIEGMILQEKEGSFKIISQDDRIRTVPKAHTVFAVRAGKLRITIYGDQFQFRTHDRIAKKFKAKPSIDL